MHDCDNVYCTMHDIHVCTVYSLYRDVIIQGCVILILRNEFKIVVFPERDSNDANNADVNNTMVRVICTSTHAIFINSDISNLTGNTHQYELINSMVHSYRLFVQRM